MTSLREALAAKRVRRDTYRVAITDDTAARAKLAEARQVAILVGAAKSDDDGAKAKAQEAVEAAQAELEACYYPLQLQAIPPADFEALVSAHPPKDRDDGAQWDEAGLTPELVAASVVGDDRLTAEEWAAEFASGRWSQGDVHDLFVRCMSLNLRAVNADLGNG